MVIVSSYAEPSEGYELFLVRLASSWEVWVRVWPAGNGAKAANITRIDIGMPIDWVYLVTTYHSASKTVRLYVNGDERSSKPGLDYKQLLTSKPNLRIGARGQDTGKEEFGFAGNIDEVAVYSSVLSPTDIKSHYTLAITPPPP